MTTKAGKIARIVHGRGFGFITPDDVPAVDHFFNIRGMHAESKSFHTLNVGDRVTFVSVAMTDKGPRAIDVKAEG